MKEVLEMKFDLTVPITIYELLALLMSIIAILIPVIQTIWRKWGIQPKIEYYPNGNIQLYFNHSGSYLQLNGVYEALNKPAVVKHIKITIRRHIDNHELNLSWSTFISPITQRVAGNAMQTNETAHPFRIDADSIMCAFTEFADPYDTFRKTFLVKTQTLFQKIQKIRSDFPDYQNAIQEYQSTAEYVAAKAFVEKEFFWSIGKYDMILETEYGKKHLTKTFEFSINDTDYHRLYQNVEESLISPLKDAYLVPRNYQYADIQIINKLLQNK